MFDNIKPTTLVLFTIVLITLCESIAQTCLKKYNVDKRKTFLLFGLLFYTVVCFLLLYCYHKNGMMGHVNMMWSMMSIILITVCGHVFYGEQMDKNDVISIGFALGAIYFINK